MNTEPGDFKDLVGDCIRYYLDEEDASPFRRFLHVNNVNDEEGVDLFTEFAAAVMFSMRTFTFSDLDEVVKTRAAFNTWLHKVFGHSYTV